MGKGKAKKGQFDDLDGDYKSAIDNGSIEEIKERIVKAALDQQELLDAKEADFDLKEKQEVAAEAGKVYSEGAKMNKLRIKYAQVALKSRGARVSQKDISDAVRNAARA